MVVQAMNPRCLILAVVLVGGAFYAYKRGWIAVPAFLKGGE